MSRETTGAGPRRAGKAGSSGPAEAWRERLQPGRTRSFLEVGVFPDRVEVYEHYGSEATERLARALARYGVRLTRRFGSPCG